MQATQQQRLTTAAACVLAAFALLPFLITFLPRIYFDVDPASPAGSAPIIALGPAGMVWLCVGASLFSATVLGWCAWLRQPIAWWAVALVGVGVVVQLIHLRPARPDNLWYGPAWIAGSLLALAAYHLCQLPGARRWIVAALIAMLVPVLIDSAYFVLVEHPLTIETFQQQQDGAGIQNVPRAAYERRLEASDAIGAFSLSNVLGSLSAVITLLAVTPAVGGRRRGARIAASVCVAAGLIGVYLTQSKGAIIGIVIGVAILALSPVLRRVRALAVVVSVGAIVMAVAAIFFIASRGVPDTTEGGARVSLLFRYHYWQGAAALVAQEPMLGTGQEGFREGYLRTKNPISPEDVRSSHNVFVDWITMLGVGGWAWSALAMTWLVMLAWNSRGREPVPDESVAIGRELWLPCAATGGVLFLAQYALQYELLVIDSALLWLVSMLAFVGVMGLLAGAAWCPKWTWAGLLAAATALLAHNQIEMTFHHAPSALPAWIILGTVASLGARERKARRIDALAGLLPAAAGVAVFVLAALPVTEQQAHLAKAAAAWRAGWGEAALRELDQAAQPIPADYVTLQWRARLRLQYAAALAQAGRQAEAQRWQRDALALCEPGAFGGVSSYRLDRMRSEVHVMMNMPDAAIEDLRRVVERVPYSVTDWLNLGDLLARTGRVSDAVDAYRRLLAVSELRKLDPTTQLSPEDRARVAGYVAAHGGSVK